MINYYYFIIRVKPQREHSISIEISTYWALNKSAQENGSTFIYRPAGCSELAALVLSASLYNKRMGKAAAADLMKQ